MLAADSEAAWAEKFSVLVTPSRCWEHISAVAALWKDMCVCVCQSTLQHMSGQISKKKTTCLTGELSAGSLRPGQIVQ